MAVIVEGGVRKKRYNGCKQIKPLTDVSPDPTKKRISGVQALSIQTCKSGDAPSEIPGPAKGLELFESQKRGE